ncbi:amidohydrolase family protein [Hoyosella rhizosphaerae]|uniref:amidohydrolase family protein n=1 Tax=Hoyosella rhizosphaerae TaxID=1755582 RepID=UPI001E59651B|nr:amidohydrolase family protein [Hoyosella rhizosphaerae]
MSEPNGALVVDTHGKIVFSGEFTEVPAECASATVTDFRPGFLLPGFVDAHVHFPQVFTTDAYGGGELLNWLDRCVFPAEARFSDPDFAREAARAFCAARVAAGTTAALVFGSAFPVAQDALFEETQRIGLRMVSGRGVQTRGPKSASALITDDATAEKLCRKEIEKWHCADAPGRFDEAMLQVALVPRFALSVTPTTFHWMGVLYQEWRDRGLYFHTHLSENDAPGVGEIDSVIRDFDIPDYLSAYDGRFLPGGASGAESLLGRRTIFAHAVHCSAEELNRIAATRSSIAHCPTSQLFLGSGTMPWMQIAARGITIALGSDVGAGDEWLISRVANDCFKVHMSTKAPDATALDPAALLFSATLAGARALDMESLFGNLDSGKDADFIVVDPALWPPLERSLSGVTDVSGLVFSLLMSMREPAIARVFVRGAVVST